MSKLFCDPVDCSTPGFPALHCLLESAQIHWISDAMWPSHPLLPPLPSVLPSIRVFFSESPLCVRLLKYRSFSFSICRFNEYSGLISFRTWLVWSCCPGDSQESSAAPQLKSSSSLTLSLLYGQSLTSVYDYFDCMDLCWQSDVSAF